MSGMFDEYDADESRIRAKVNMFVATRVPLSEAIEVGKLVDLHGYRVAFDRVLEIAQADAAKETGNDVAARVFHRGTRLRAPRRPISDAVKLEYVREFVKEWDWDWESGEAAIVYSRYLFEGLESAFREAHRMTKDRERKQMEEVLVVFMNPGSASVDEHVDQIKDADLPKEDPSIRDLFSGPHWRTHVARYFGFS